VVLRFGPNDNELKVIFASIEAFLFRQLDDPVFHELAYGFECGTFSYD
jgi:hypothetical protein